MGKSGYCKISRLRGLDIAKYYIRKVYDKYYIPAGYALILYIQIFILSKLFLNLMHHNCLCRYHLVLKPLMSYQNIYDI